MLEFLKTFRRNVVGFHDRVSQKLVVREIFTAVMLIDIGDIRGVHDGLTIAVYGVVR